jgi:acyl-CoA synthetase (AMP-forming)/AMP-acid ligase II
MSEPRPPDAGEPALIRCLESHARLRPEAKAVYAIGKSGVERCFSWRELRDAAAGVAARLCTSGDCGVVMACAENRPEVLAVILGGLWAGADVLLVPPDLPAAGLVELAQRASASTWIAAEPALGALSDAVPTRLPIASLVAQRSSGTKEARPRDGGSILLQSSGTTGLPKIVRRGSAALHVVGENCRRALGVGTTDTMLVSIPLCHSYGIDQGVLTAIAAGCTVELHEHFDPGRVATALTDRPISVLPAVPLMFEALARHARGPTRARALRRAYSAGSALPCRIFDAFEQAYGLKIGQIYGATEFGSVAFNDPESADFEPSAAGLPMDGVEIRILDADDPRVDQPLAPDREGEVAVASPSMLSDYLDGPSPISQGFFLTGDLGRLERSGVLRLTGRSKLLINVGGLKVNPLEVEAMLVRHPDVKESVALEIPYSDTASRVKAIVVPEAGRDLSGEQLRRFAQKHLDPHKVPRVFEIRDTLPHSPTGKILRRELQEAERVRAR